MNKSYFIVLLIRWHCIEERKCFLPSCACYFHHLNLWMWGWWWLLKVIKRRTFYRKEKFSITRKTCFLSHWFILLSLLIKIWWKHLYALHTVLLKRFLSCEISLCMWKIASYIVLHFNFFFILLAWIFTQYQSVWQCNDVENILTIIETKFHVCQKSPYMEWLALLNLSFLMVSATMMKI